MVIGVYTIFRVNPVDTKNKSKLRGTLATFTKPKLYLLSCNIDLSNMPTMSIVKAFKQL